MATGEYSDFQRYLAAKRTVDDRALNRHVWDSFLTCVADAPSPLRLLEVGSGIGTMIERLLESGHLPVVDYTAIDADPQNIGTAAERLAHWAKIQQTQLESIRLNPDSAPQDFDITIQAKALSHLADTRWNIHLRSLDLFTLLAQPPESHPHAFDGLVAHAFLDLVDAKSVLRKLTTLLKPGAHLLLTINFDGATIFQPDIDPAYDRQIESLYHATMDNRIVNGQPSGDSRTGRHLYHILRRAGYTVLDAGSSDWVVAPFGGEYVADEAYFLHFIVNTVYGALADHPRLSGETFRQWIKERHAQIDRTELLYIAHQIDYVARYESS